MITALCNVYINSDLKLKLFKDTFRSVYGVSDNWLIYFRGKFRKEANLFVQELDTAGHAVTFERLNEDCWGLAVKEMLAYSKYDYIYIYIEDHFLIGGLDLFKEVIRDAAQSRVDYFAYSFFNADIDFNTMESSYPEYSKHLAVFELSGKNKDDFKKNNRNFFPFSLVSVVSKEYFYKILGREYYKNIPLPSFIQMLMLRFNLGYPKNRILLRVINRLLNPVGVRLTLYTSASPLNMEKSIYEMDAELLPLKIGIVNREIFANFDDDNGAKKESMIKRGEYPKRLKVEDAIIPVVENQLKQYKINAKEVVSRQFYLKSSRQTSIYMKYILVNEGKIRISAPPEEYIINKNESICIYANVPHQIEGLEDSIYSVKIYPAESWVVGDYY